MSKKHSDKFIDFLVSLKEAENRGALAALKKGLGRPLGTVTSMHRYVAGWANSSYESTNDMYYLVASLFAYYPEHTDENENGGDIYRKVQDTFRSDNIEKRFIILLDSDEQTFAKHLQRMVGLAKSKNIKINWKTLLYDLCYWTHEDGFVQKNWARAFWAPKNDTKNKENEKENTK